MKILLITDNENLLNRFLNIVKEKKLNIDYAYSYNNKYFVERYKKENWIKPIKIKENISNFISVYDIIFSLHCKQIFPEELVNNIRCINIHPGLNPYNRGWYPQVFSIINGLPIGATIHEIDNELDHGGIIVQREVNIEMWDTSLSVYNKVIDTETELLNENLEAIINNNYKVIKPDEGNLNLNKDFINLCEIDLQDKDTFLNHINRLRALTHDKFKNAYFYDKNGNKIYLKLELTKA